MWKIYTMKAVFKIVLFTLSIQAYSADSLEVYTFKNQEDADLYNIVVNDTNGYPRQDALRYTDVVYDSTLQEFILYLDKVTYKALKDNDIKVKKIKKDKMNILDAILNDKLKIPKP